MGSSLPIILHIFSILFPSPSVFFFHSFFSGPYSLPLPLIFSLPTFFFLPSLFSFSSFLSPYFPPSSPYLLSCLLSFLFLPSPSFCALFFLPMSCLSHASPTPPSLSTLLSSHHFLSQLSFYPSVIHPLPIVFAAFFPYLPYPSFPCCFLLYPKTLPLKAMWVYASSLSSRFHCYCLVTWGYLRITQSLNQLQLILQQVLLFWSREATCEGIANFCQSENKIYAVIPLAQLVTGQKWQRVLLLFCFVFFLLLIALPTVDIVTLCRYGVCVFCCCWQSSRCCE